MRRVLMTVAMVLGLAMGASAADRPVFPDQTGVFTLGCQDTKAFRGEAFSKDTDTFNMEFTTEAGAVLGTVEVDTSGIARLSTTIGGQTDVRVVCFSIDRSGNRSDRSVDSFLVDRTPPEAPTVLAP